MKVNHDAEVVIGEYQFADSLKEEILYHLKFAKTIGHTNVKASLHTEWGWLSDNQKVKNFKSFIATEIEKNYQMRLTDGGLYFVKNTALWANVYKKGDYAQRHNHLHFAFSVAYFLKVKWYDSPLIFSDSGKRIRPKEGRYVIFPSYLNHHVPKHRYNHDRITLSANYDLKSPKKK
tara:strand:+ start:51 stop:578 length:528 start_codon:yes stop_codon:yes gene_type:complete